MSRQKCLLFSLPGCCFMDICEAGGDRQMLLREKEVALVAESYLRDELSQKEKDMVIKDIMGAAEIAIMEIIRRQVKMAQSQ